MVLRTLELCSGYAGFELGLKLAGVPARTVCHVERDAYAAANLVARMEDQALDLAPIWSDLVTFDTAPWRGSVDLITAGFPCQPFSAAGRQRGVDDDRWLWPHIARIIRDLGPRYVFLENVPQLVKHGLPYVLHDLAQLGFDAQWSRCSAADVGAPHKRQRIWILGYTNGNGCEGQRERLEGDQGRLEGNADRPDGADTGLADAGRQGREGGNQFEPSHGVPSGCGTGLADPESLGGVQGHGPGASEPNRWTVPDAGGGLTPWPPRRNDHAGWERYLAEGGPEPALRRGADGRPAGLADALHLGGNGLVPAVAGYAFTALAIRAGLNPWEE